MNKPWVGCVHGSQTHQLQIKSFLYQSQWRWEWGSNTIFLRIHQCRADRSTWAITVFLPVHRTCCEPRSTGHQTTPRSPARTASPPPAQRFKRNYFETALKQADQPEQRCLGTCFCISLVCNHSKSSSPTWSKVGSHILSDRLRAECYFMGIILSSSALGFQWAGSYHALTYSFPWRSPGRSRDRWREALQHVLGQPHGLLQVLQNTHCLTPEKASVAGKTPFSCADGQPGNRRRATSSVLIENLSRN